MATPQVLDNVRTQLIESGRDSRYALGAYNFLFNGMEFYLTRIGEKRHVTGQELSRGLMEFACKQFGALALDVLQSWGIHSTDDFGYIVYNLIDIGQMSKQPADRLEDFFNVFDLGEYCRGQEIFQIDPDYIRSVRGA
jgi:uncharacterized repeat protein (TIGR04138 family)